jgi:hypothetical protein
VVQIHQGPPFLKEGIIMNIDMKSITGVSIDGRNFSGKNISINNGKVTVDGVVQGGELVGNVTVVIHGDVNHITNTTGNVTANNVHNIITSLGDVDCKDVMGNITTSLGNVDCLNVGGNIQTTLGDVTKR